MTELSDLEAVAIAFVRRHPRCTPYDVRRYLQDAPAARFSDSAGSIYPLMRRLEERELLKGDSRSGDGRRAREFLCTVTGERALVEWLSPPFAPDRFFTADPLRTRMIYLEALSADERRNWLDEAETMLLEQLKIVEAHRDAKGGEKDLYFDLASDNAREETKARLSWIRASRKKLIE